MERTLEKAPATEAGCLLWISPAFRALVPDEPRAAYDALMRLEPEDDYHAKQGRSTGRYEIEGPSGPVKVYIKKYLRPRWWQRWVARLAELPGPLEMARLEQARQLGIFVPEPIAAGADRRNACFSFLIVRSLEGFQPLHQYIPARFASIASPLDREHKRALIRRLADVGRRLHAERLFHLDFYLCHFFIRPDPTAPDGFQLALIDLLRLKHSRRERWRVKDLAGLLFSADWSGITRTDKLRFWKYYCGQKRLDAASRRLLRTVMRKAYRYHRHNWG